MLKKAAFGKKIKAGVSQPLSVGMKFQWDILLQKSYYPGRENLISY
jgi:hypothetical protein